MIEFYNNNKNTKTIIIDDNLIIYLLDLGHSGNTFSPDLFLI